MSIVTHGNPDTVDGYKPFEALHREVQQIQTPLRTAITQAYRRDDDREGNQELVFAHIHGVMLLSVGLGEADSDHCILRMRSISC